MTSARFTVRAGDFTGVRPRVGAEERDRPRRDDAGVPRRRPRRTGGLAAQVHVPGSVAGGRRPLGDDAQAHDVRADRRARWPRRPPVSPSRSAASATGTTATPGCATPRSPSMPSSGSGTPRRRPLSACGCANTMEEDVGRRRAAPHHVPGRRQLRPGRGDPRPLRGLPRVARRCGSATAPPISSSSTSTAKPWTRSGSSTGRGAARRRPGLDDIVTHDRLAVRALGRARRGHLGDPRRPQAASSYGRLMCVGRVRPRHPHGARPGLPADIERWTEERDQIYS